MITWRLASIFFILVQTNIHGLSRLREKYPEKSQNG